MREIEDETTDLDTSIISYLTSSLSRDMVVATHQQLTQEWWLTQADLYEVYVSELVWEEAQAGDAGKAKKRLVFLSQLRLLSFTHEARRMADLFVQQHALPSKAYTDASHIAIATVHSVDYLLTWNFKHMVNPFLQKSLRKVIELNDYEMPTLCTPEELLLGEKRL